MAVLGDSLRRYGVESSFSGGIVAKGVETAQTKLTFCFNFLDPVPHSPLTCNVCHTNLPLSRPMWASWLARWYPQRARFISLYLIFPPLISLFTAPIITSVNYFLYLSLSLELTPSPVFQKVRASVNPGTHISAFTSYSRGNEGNVLRNSLPVPSLFCTSSSLLCLI